MKAMRLTGLSAGFCLLGGVIGYLLLPEPGFGFHFERQAELYIAIGHNKHGKTEMYRGLIGHLESSTDSFVLAPGEAGLVMVVFTLPSYDVVFKVIRDRFAPPKATT